MAKLYKFEQISDGCTESYFHMTGTLEEVLQKWCHGPWPQHKGEYIGYSTDCYNSLYFQVLTYLDRQSMFIEIVDKNVYGLGWVTKINEAEE